MQCDRGSTADAEQCQAFDDVPESYQRQPVPYQHPASDLCSRACQQVVVKHQRHHREPQNEGTFIMQLETLELLKEFKENQEYVHMALVVDEFGNS